VRGMRVGVPQEYLLEGIEPGVLAAFERALSLLEDLGAVVDRGVQLPSTTLALPVYYLIAPSEASANLARYDGVKYGFSDRSGNSLWDNIESTRAQGFGPEVKRRIMLGTYALSAGYYDAYYLKAQKVRTLIKADFDALWSQGFDALVAPTAPTVAFPFGARMSDPVAMYLSDACTLPVNMAGLPGISIPCGLADGLPVGLQLIGAPWQESTLFDLARGYEAITADAPWRAMEPAALAQVRDPATPTPLQRAALAAARTGNGAR
jgi:aspartyl-tRNA(Asn)/glutamyl-tRNA(Gln) amidotransferase subunit A